MLEGEIQEFRKKMDMADAEIAVLRNEKAFLENKLHEAEANFTQEYMDMEIQIAALEEVVVAQQQETREWMSIAEFYQTMYSHFPAAYL